MKQVILLFLGLMVIANSSLAQRGEFMEHPPEERAEIQTTLMSNALSLADSSRINKIYEINLKYAKKMEELTNNGGSRQRKFREMRSISENKDKELKKALTDEQYKEYLKLKEQMRKRMIEETQNRRKEENGS